MLEEPGAFGICRAECVRSEQHPKERGRGPAGLEQKASPEQVWGQVWQMRPIPEAAASVFGD